jgi:large subunit ribosomal protein L10
MAKTRSQKQDAVAQLSSDMKSASSVVFANYHGLSVAQMEELRAKCREIGVGYTVSKKTLVKRALADMGVDINTKEFDGGVAVVTGPDEVAASKVVASFAKDNEVVKMFGGMLEGKVISLEKVEALSRLPSKQELLAKLVCSMKSPISGFANVLAGNLRGLVGVLSAIKESKS